MPSHMLSAVDAVCRLVIVRDSKRAGVGHRGAEAEDIAVHDRTATRDAFPANPKGGYNTILYPTGLLAPPLLPFFFAPLAFSNVRVCPWFRPHLAACSINNARLSAKGQHAIARCFGWALRRPWHDWPVSILVRVAAQPAVATRAILSSHTWVSVWATSKRSPFVGLLRAKRHMQM